MVPVYICDDNGSEKEYLRKTVENLILIEGIDMRVVLAAQSPEEILTHRKTHASRSVYILDVDLKHELHNGFTLAKHLRELDTRGFIIFVTTHEEMMVETFRYRVEAMDYLIKEETNQLTARLRECLTEINRLVCHEKRDTLSYYTVKTDGCEFHIPMEELFYFRTSADAHRVTLHAKDRVLEFRGELNALEKDIGDCFIRIHRSFLVRADKIRQVDSGGGTLVMADGAVCQVSRKGKKLLKEYFERVEL